MQDYLFNWGFYGVEGGTFNQKVIAYIAYLWILTSISYYYKAYIPTLISSAASYVIYLKWISRLMYSNQGADINFIRRKPLELPSQAPLPTKILAQSIWQLLKVFPGFLCILAEYTYFIKCLLYFRPTTHQRTKHRCVCVCGIVYFYCQLSIIFIGRYYFVYTFVCKLSSTRKWKESQVGQNRGLWHL